MMISIAGWCQRTGETGVAVAASEMAIGNRSPLVRGGCGAVAVMNAPSPALGEEVLNLFQSGLGPTSTLNLVTEGREFIDHRMIVMVSADGQTGHFTGASVEERHAACEVEGAVAGGCNLTFSTMPSAMIVSFEQSQGEALGTRLCKALEAGLGQVGENHPFRSSSLLISGKDKWPFIDLRVDWHQSAPVDVLFGLWKAYRSRAANNIETAMRPDNQSDDN